MEGESRPLILIRTRTLGRTERVAKGVAQGSVKGGGERRRPVCHLSQSKMPMFRIWSQESSVEMRMTVNMERPRFPKWKGSVSW